VPAEVFVETKILRIFNVCRRLKNRPCDALRLAPAQFFSQLKSSACFKWIITWQRTLIYRKMRLFWLHWGNCVWCLTLFSFLSLFLANFILFVLLPAIDCFNKLWLFPKSTANLFSLAKCAWIKMKNLLSGYLNDQWK